MSKHPKQPKRCTSCAGKGLYVWTDRAGIVHGLTCNDCKGTGKERPVTPITDYPSPIPNSHA